LKAGTIFEINAQGLRGGLRGKQDGCTLMGSVEKDLDGYFINDLLIPAADAGIGSRHCLIKYQRESLQYELKDLGDGSGTFIKLVSSLVSFWYNSIRF